MNQIFTIFIIVIIGCQNYDAQDTLVEGNLEVCKSFNNKGLLHGAYWHYDTKIGIEVKGQYKNGLKSGYWEWEDSLFQGQVKANYKNGLLDEEYTLQNYDFETVFKYNYKDGILNGDYIVFYNDAYNGLESIQLEGKYKDGLKEGKWHYYSKDLNHLSYLFVDESRSDLSSDWVDRVTYYYQEGIIEGEAYSILGAFNYSGKFKEEKWLWYGDFVEGKKQGKWTFQDIFSDDDFGTSICTIKYNKDSIVGRVIVKKMPRYQELVIDEAFLKGTIKFQVVEVDGSFEEGVLVDGARMGLWKEYDANGNENRTYNNTTNEHTFTASSAHIVISDLDLRKVDFIDIDSLDHKILFAAKNSNRDLKYWIYDLHSKKLITSGLINFTEGYISAVNLIKDGVNQFAIYDIDADKDYVYDYIEDSFKPSEYEEDNPIYFTLKGNLIALGLNNIEEIGIRQKEWEHIKKEKHYGHEFSFKTASGIDYTLNLSKLSLSKSKKIRADSKFIYPQRSIRYCTDIQLSYQSENDSSYISKYLLEDVAVNRDYYFGLLPFTTPMKTLFFYVDSTKASYTLKTDMVGTVNFWNSKFEEKSKRIVKFNINEEGKYVFYANDGYFYATKGLNDVLYFELDKKLFPFEQFDLKYNRPDIILDRLGYADSSLITAYHKAYLKRLKKMNFTEDMLKDDFHLPEIEIENFESMPTILDADSIDLNFNIKDSKYNLDRINLWINDVAIYGSNGISLRELNTQEHQRKLTVHLAKGNNKIQVSVLNQAGAESYKETLEMECTKGKTQPDLYLITIGESKFKDAQYNLSFAAKDAKDIAEQFSKSKVFKNVYAKTLTNEQVTKENVIALKSFLQKAGINDQVMIFVAGHGVLDANLDYFFGTYDMDFNNPSERGLAYEDLEGLLDGIAPLKKTLLIDACHSGEIDKDEVELLAQIETTTGDVQFRAVGHTAKAKLGVANTSELTKSLFTDLRKGTGATVISAAGGMEFAMESGDWNNGLFTFALLNGIQTKKADLNKDGEIWLSELQKYVQEEVVKLSGGKQQPTSRIENQVLDYRVW